MRRALAVAIAVLALGSVVPAQALVAGSGVPVAPLAGVVDPGPGFYSDNVEYVATIPIDSPGVSAKLVKLGKQKRLYVSSVNGLGIYDVTEPASPQLLGRLPLPNWENEDVQVSADGNTVIFTEFTGTGYIHFVDASNPALPVLVSTLPLESGGHIADCLDARCDVIYGSEGQVIDARDKAAPKTLELNWAEHMGLPTNGHNIQLADSKKKIAIADVTPMAIFSYADPLDPKLLARGDEKVADDAGTAYQHNNVWPRAVEYKERAPGGGPLKAGELVMGNGETNFTGRCDDGSGPFATYSVRGYGKSKKIQLLEVFRPVSGTYADGNPAVNAMGCSGHWFTVQHDGPNYLVAAAWYEHGTRFLRVDGATGKVTELGHFVPGVGATSSAMWIDAEHVYSIDYQRGIDILRFDTTKPAASKVQTEAAWLGKAGVVDPLAAAERQFCRIAGAERG